MARLKSSILRSQDVDVHLGLRGKDRSGMGLQNTTAPSPGAQILMLVCAGEKGYGRGISHDGSYIVSVKEHPGPSISLRSTATFCEDSGALGLF